MGWPNHPRLAKGVAATPLLPFFLKKIIIIIIILINFKDFIFLYCATCQSQRLVVKIWMENLTEVPIGFLPLT
jgi:hypothetical protein